METSTNLVYLPVYVQPVDNITVSVVDQEDDTINFGGEVITARLQLKLVMGLPFAVKKKMKKKSIKENRPSSKRASRGLTLKNLTPSKRSFFCFIDWNLLALLYERVTNGLIRLFSDVKLKFQKREYKVNVKDVFVIRCFVRFKNTKDNSIATDENEWTCFIKPLTTVNKYVVRLFDEQDKFKDYMNIVLSRGQYVHPPFTLCDQITYDQLPRYDVMYGKALDVTADNTATGMNMH